MKTDIDDLFFDEKEMANSRPDGGVSNAYTVAPKPKIPVKNKKKIRNPGRFFTLITPSRYNVRHSIRMMDDITALSKIQFILGSSWESIESNKRQLSHENGVSNNIAESLNVQIFFASK